MSRLYVALVAVALTAGCASSPTPTVEPGGGDTADGSQLARGTPGCPPVLGADDPDPFGGSSHPSLAGDWYESLSRIVDEAHRDDSGGLYLDQEAGQVVVVAVGADPESLVDQLRAEVPEDHREDVACRHGMWSQDQLEAVLDTAMTAASGPASGGLDTVRNRVEVQLEDGDPVALRRAVAEDVGVDAAAALTVTVPECAEVIADPPADAVALPGEGSTCSGMDALAEGVLGGDPATGCLVLEHGDGIEPTALLFPRGYTVTPDGVVRDHRGEVWAELGDELAVGGGGVPVEEGDDPCGAGDLGAFLLSGDVTPG